MGCWLVVCGIIEGSGLVFSLARGFIIEDVLATNIRANKDPPPNVYGKPNLVSFKASPNALAFSARADLGAKYPSGDSSF